MIDKVCESCGKTYQSIYSRRNRSRFCSVICKNASQSHLKIIETVISRACKICGKEFNTTNRMNGLKTCSKKCADKARGGRRPINKIRVYCKICSKPINIFPSRKSVRKYCSYNCQHIGAAEERRGQIRASTIEKCPNCDKNFKRFESRKKTGEGIYCSKKCYLSHSSSNTENKVSKWLKDHNIQFIEQTIVGKWHVDFGANGFAIEVNGCYWHGCSIHFPDNLNKSQIQSINRDRRLQDFCIKNKINLLIIWEHDVNNKDYSSLLPLLLT